LTTEQLLPVIKVSPNLLDLNLRYAEKVDAKALTKGAELKQLKFLNVLNVGRNSSKAKKALEGTGAEFYYQGQPF
jgi:hypothetical protein